MTELRKWRVWVDKDGHITSHRPYLPTSPVEWIEVTEVKPYETPETLLPAPEQSREPR